MFLKSLTLRGFKSFADKTTLEFQPGVTVVVGPNGSGKSNLVDAVAWVLGAQGPRTLRGGKMHDVIFAGTPRRTALGRAEVSLTIDNTAHLLPIEFSEVTISRTLFRTTGESEYALNGVPCRLLDIQELLSDTGIGRQQHVIVGQGQLDTVLNASPGERRAIVEEAAGILKYRRRKERAQRHLETTEGTLVRLGDLLREVRRQLGPLQRQAEAAARHDSVRDELRAIRMHLAGHQLAGLQVRLSGLHEEAVSLHERDRYLRERLAELDEQVLGAERALTAMGDDDVADWLTRVEALRARGAGTAALVAEKRRGAVRELASAADEGVVESLVADADTLRRELAALDAGPQPSAGEAWPERPGSGAAESGQPESSAGEAWPERPGSGAAESGQEALRAAEERWRTSEGEAARTRARSEALSAQLATARAAVGAEGLQGVEGVLGPFVDHLEIEPGMEEAVAGALGDALRAVVVERGDSLYDVFERLEQAQVGSVLLVVDRFGPSPSQGALVPPGARRLADVVRSNVPRLQAVIERLLAHCVLVDGWLRALDVVVDHPELVAVTRAGDRIGGVEPWRFGSHSAPVVTQAVVDDAAAHATRAEVRRADAQRAVETARAALAAARAAEVRRATVDERRSVLGARLVEVEARLAARDDQAQDAARRHRAAILARDAAYARLAAELEELLGTVSGLTERLRARRQQRVERARASAEQLDALRTARAGLEGDLAGVRERSSRAEIEEAETRLRLETAVDAVRSEFDCEPSVALDAPAPEVPEGTTLSGRARELERDLRLMGPVNPLALEEHRALQERHEFLQQQLDDIRNTRRELNRVIRAVDQEIVTIFQQAFRDVSEHFSALFMTLFPGGSGSISLVDPDDLLETGIEIEARPSGKNVRRLSLLSGGERSLTALAYLFAVFRARPSPFYLLDEVEAALDDVNLHRFVELVHEFRDEAQLVIVTHQKRTMEAADILYGVSMPPGGSTRVVSQRVTGELVALDR